jgi:RNA-binding protein YhbY
VRNPNHKGISSIDEIARKVQHESALIRIGKNGLTPNIQEELVKLVKQKQAVKVKILQNTIDEQLFEKLKMKTGLKIWRQVGKVAIFIE